MKRIRYISQFSRALAHEELEELARVSAENNRKDGITGMLVASGELFFQLIEGPAERIDEVYARILSDARHQNVLTLSVEQGNFGRLCPDWAMQQFDLNDEVSGRSELAKSILGNIFHLHKVVSDMVDTLEQFTWRELLEVSGELTGSASSAR